ncbi:hypothetical protein [Roseococcus sp. YIM B11640]|uniref:hypothetical protein n=1 Tax=Roseococcus sp. YIM B11640 TaxID=3133973 RepID=UPI003C79C72C
MPHDQARMAAAELPRPEQPPHAASIPEVAQPVPALQPLVHRTCLALRAMATSVEAMEQVLSRIDALVPREGAHGELLAASQETVTHTVSLLHAEGPPLMRRVETLRAKLHDEGHSPRRSADRALRAIEADLAALPGPAAGLRRLRANILIVLAEFDRHHRTLSLG